MDIDVVLPTLDPDLDRLDRAISSVLSQAEADPHVIVVDDTDDDSVRNRLSRVEGRVTYVRGPGTTLAAALNAGVDAGDAPLVARQDADDVSLPSRLHRQRETFRQHAALDLLGTGARIVRPSGREPTRRVKAELSADDFAGGNPIVHGSVMVRRETFDRVGGYDERFPTSEDLELWVRMLERGCRLRNLDSPLYELHLHGDSVYADQLRETKLFGRFARMYASGETDDSMDRRVLEDGDVEWIYTAMSDVDRCEFHQEMAIELLRYGDRAAARRQVRKSLTCNRFHVTRLATLLLSYSPLSVVNVAVSIARRLKNRRIRRANDEPGAE